jgi:cobalt-zinc-cadmium resistance protein CzcA
MALLAAIVRFSLKNRAVVLILSLLLAVLGLRAAVNLPIDAVPDVTNVQVQVITAAPALSPTEVEQYVSAPVERAMAGVPKSTQIRSVSKYGLSVVTVVFQEGTDIYFARQQVAERMREAEDAVPDRYGKPKMGPISSGLGEIYQFTVKNDRLTLMQLEEILDWQIAPQLRMVPGIVEVNSFGGEDRQYQVLLDPKRLQASSVSILQVIDALEKSNANAGGGYVQSAREQVVVGTEGMVTDLADLSRVVIGATPQGVPITVATVGDVRFGARIRRGAATKNGDGEVVIGVAMMLLGENSRTVTEAVKKKLREIEPSLPEGTRIEPFYDRSVLVNRTVHTVVKNLAEGAALVMLVLFLLLGDLRAGLVVAAVIPLSLLMALIVMNAFGLSGNLMSLGAIDFGLLIDGAVIIVENVVRRLGERTATLGRALTPDEHMESVESAALEVRSASVFGEAIVAIVYFPILTLTATEGKLFRPMATTVLLALGGAFVLSLTMVPALASVLVKAPKHEETWFIRKAHALYVPLLERAMKHRWVTVSLAVAALAASVVLVAQVGAEFLPQLDEGDLLVEARRMPGIGIDESVRTSLRLEKALKTIPEVTSVVSRTGAPEVATDPMGIEQSDVYVNLADRASWRPGVQKDDIARAITEKAEENVPEMAVAVSQPIQMRTNELVEGIRSDVALLIYGRDVAELRRLATAAAEVIAKVPGAVDVRVEPTSDVRYLRVIPDRAKLARYGLTIDDVNQAVETLAVGRTVGDVLEADRRFTLVVKTELAFSGELEPVRALPLRAVTGQVVPLGDVAEVAFTTGPSQISREAQSRRTSLEFNVRNRDLLSVVEDARAAVTQKVKFPSGYRGEWGGQFEHYLEAKGRLLFVVPLALALILFLLWSAFHSTRAALLIFVNVPFAVAGGMVALFVRQIPFSISAGVGFIALFGVAVLNGLVLVSAARHRQEEGVPVETAIRDAAERRLRPVLMTALVASLGFVPMALSTAPGAEVQRPLATVVIGGLATATLLTLLVFPVLYAFFLRRRPT